MVATFIRDTLNAEVIEEFSPTAPEKLGVVEEGALAHLLLVDGNPLENIRLVEDPGKNFQVIMKNGTIFKNSLPK